MRDRQLSGIKGPGFVAWPKLFLRAEKCHEEEGDRRGEAARKKTAEAEGGRPRTHRPLEQLVRLPATCKLEPCSKVGGNNEREILMTEQISDGISPDVDLLPLLPLFLGC